MEPSTHVLCKRRSGGGRHLIEIAQPDLPLALEHLIRQHMPINDVPLLWSSYTLAQFNKALAQRGFYLSSHTLFRVLKRQHYRYQSSYGYWKALDRTESPLQAFIHLTETLRCAEHSHNPVIFCEITKTQADSTETHIPLDPADMTHTADVILAWWKTAQPRYLRASTLILVINGFGLTPTHVLSLDVFLASLPLPRQYEAIPPGRFRWTSVSPTLDTTIPVVVSAFPLFYHATLLEILNFTQ